MLLSGAGYPGCQQEMSVTPVPLWISCHVVIVGCCHYN